MIAVQAGCRHNAKQAFNHESFGRALVKICDSAPRISLVAFWASHAHMSTSDRPICTPQRQWPSTSSKQEATYPLAAVPAPSVRLVVQGGDATEWTQPAATYRPRVVVVHASQARPWPN